jgi:soluble lytic murein transglycosylase
MLRHAEAAPTIPYRSQHNDGAGGWAVLPVHRQARRHVVGSFCCKLFGAKDDGLNIPSFSRVLTAFAIVSVLGIVLQVDTAGGGDDQKAEAMPADAAASSLPSPDLAAVKAAIALARKGDPAQASDVEESIGDPVARKVVEWAILRSDNKEVDFQRYVAFISDNPSWPNIGLLRQRAEAVLWKERLDPQTVRAYFDKDQPLTAQGKFALARALLLEGDRADAQKLVRDAWRYDNFSGDLEAQILDVFTGLITDADHKTRMDIRLYAEDVDGAMRSANRAGGNAPVIAKARVAVIKKAADAKAQLDGVPEEARGDIGYIFSRAQWLRREEKETEAAELILSVTNDPTQALDADQWWIERRFLSRTLLDLNDAKTAYRVASAAAVPSRENYRVEQQFTSGWIALRFLNDASTSLAHFAKVGQGTNNPITLARAYYWQGRAAEALGKNNDARAHYEMAARYSTAYYGQLAGARLGLKDIVILAPPDPTSARRDVVRAIEILYAIGERDLTAGGLAELGERSMDMATLAAVGAVAARHKDARAMVLLGKAAVGRGLPLEHFAFPTVGIPDYRAIGPAVEPGIVYAIARQESSFNPRAISSARAVGLMQVTPAAGRSVANKFGAPYDEKRLLDNSTYNVQLGAAELGDLIKYYRGSYILAFAGYNAGRGRVKDWIAKYGDPRDPKIDPIDWVERIPFSETRNYVQRVLENLQVYRMRFGGGSKLLIEADLRRGARSN